MNLVLKRYKSSKNWPIHKKWSKIHRTLLVLKSQKAFQSKTMTSIKNPLKMTNQSMKMTRIQSINSAHVRVHRVNAAVTSQFHWFRFGDQVVRPFVIWTTIVCRCRLNMVIWCWPHDKSTQAVRLQFVCHCQVATIDSVDVSMVSKSPQLASLSWPKDRIF